MAIKKWKKFNEENDFDQSVNTMKNTSEVYTKYKQKVTNMINSEDLNKSTEDFNNFIESLSEEEKTASDLLRSYFNSEMMRAKIEELEANRKAIEEEIAKRIEELKQMQSNLP